jgi:hypothetical protein
MIEFKGCKHLIFDREKISNNCKIVALPGGCGAFWRRCPEFTAHIGNGVKEVQFCELRGRLNSKVACLKRMAECPKYEEVTHKVEVEVDE